VLAGVAWDRMELSRYAIVRRAATTILCLLVIYQFVISMVVVPLLYDRFGENRIAGKAASLPASGSVWQHCVFQASSPDALKNVRRYWHFCVSPTNFALDQGVPQRRRTMYGSRGGWVIDT